MTRPKVPLEARQRTQQACTSCKKRKQKSAFAHLDHCNGLCPCVTCDKRKFECIYDDRIEPESPDASAASPPKKRKREYESVIASPKTSNPAITPRVISQTPRSAPVSGLLNGRGPTLQPRPEPTSTHDASAEIAARSLQSFSVPRLDASAIAQENAPTPNLGPEEEATVYSQTRMLQDPTGRLLYVGDSATLSFLQLIRMMIETVCGPSPFTDDPNRHKIMESQFSLPANARSSLLIPHKTTAIYLAEAFFINTQGLVHVFDRKAFYRALDNTYTDPLSASTNWLCLLNLVFAIGLTMAAPAQGTPEAAVIDKLRLEHSDRAEIFYLNAKGLNDPMVGLEDADFWSVQALILMTVFMLAKSKRNTAFALLGMAIRSAYALGLHREETLSIFDVEDQAVRRSVWRSLFVMDRFLSCSLGRPPGISEDECSGDILKSSHATVSIDDFGFNHAFLNTTNSAQTGTYGLEAAVRSCSIIGVMLKQIYQQRRVSTRLAQEIADICKEWPKELHEQLHWRQASSASPSQGIAILHVNLFYCHSIVLLTRPFFLFILNDVLQQGDPTVPRSRRNYARMEKFSEACVIASTHSVVLVQNAFEAAYLPRRNPFVIYFLFAATLILMSNEFALLYINAAADQCMRNAISVMAYCAETDPQANRLLYILSTFRDVIIQRRDQRFNSSRQAQSSNQLPPFNMRANVNPYGSMVPQPPTPSSSTQSNNQTGITLPPMSNPLSFCLKSNPPHNPLNTTPAPQSPLNPTTSHSQTPILLPTISLPQTGTPSPFQHTSRPLEPSLSSPAPPNPLSSHPSGVQTPVLGTWDRSLSFSNIFDLSALGDDRNSVSEESNGQDEQIDFDALWQWGGATPAMGSPKGVGIVGNGNGSGFAP